MKIVTILGARPQFVKAATVSRRILERNDIREVIIHTGQHFDNNMSDIFFKEMAIPEPKYNLEINSLSHGAMTGKMLEAIEPVLFDEKPDCILVYGDTNSTIAGALAAKKLNLKVVHVEAGLRSFNNKMPEEINRILTDRISDLLFCPTNTAVQNLYDEGFKKFNCKIIKCGDVMYDAALYYAKISSEKSSIIKKMNLSDFVLCTIHRPENTDNIHNLRSIINAINTINKQIQVVLPIHPRTTKILKQHKLNIDCKLIKPVGYFDMIELLKHCRIVMTDSGGLQKEAFFFKKHCITMREQTEWVELVDNGFSVVVGSDENKIIKTFNLMMNKKSDFNINLYGTGKASSIIVEKLLD